MDCPDSTASDAVSAVRAMQQAAMQEPKRDREEGKALDLSNMLRAPSRGGAECEGQCRNHRASRVPAAVLEVRENGYGGTSQQQQDVDIEQHKAGCGEQCSEKQRG